MKKIILLCFILASCTNQINRSVNDNAPDIPSDQLIEVSNQTNGDLNVSVDSGPLSFGTADAAHRELLKTITIKNTSDISQSLSMVKPASGFL